jgi:diguanylate cyclase (GGDEF)-like protein/PAS domain S-box-containing protein
MQAQTQSKAAAAVTAFQPALHALLEAVEHSPVTVVITDGHGRIEYVNGALCRVTGYEQSELIGDNPRRWQSGLTPPEVYESLWQTIVAGGTWTGDLLNRRRSGELYWERLRIAPVRDEHGNITRFFALGEDLTAQRETEARLSFLLAYDPLTGLPNREHTVRTIAERLAGDGSDVQTRAVLVIGLDRFRAVNAGFGRSSGDEVLRQLAQRLRSSLRRDDLLARIGGDEFALVIDCLDSQRAAYELAARIRQQATEPFRVAGHEVNLSCSIGMAFAPEHGNSAEGLVERAMSAMFAAKQTGRNAVRAYASDIDEREVRRLDLVTGLRHALALGQLFLDYQPQVDLISGEIIAAEALVRWRHPERGVIPPAEFIPLAEETELIIDLGSWVLHEACRQASRWQGAGLRPVRVAINLSPRHFHRPELIGEVGAALRESGLDARWLEIELTESAMMHDSEAAIAMLSALKGIGVHIALDDFGTGFSSLAYLSRLPVDVLKIDRSFVTDITSNPVNAAIARTTIAMAHNLGMRVVAEGVENDGQLSYLSRQDCDAAQGFLLGRPMAPAALAALLQGGTAGLNGNRALHDPSRTLLLVDDEPNVLKALWRLFRREGYQILTAGSGREALDMLATQAVRVIVSDQRMPEMSGTELLSRVKDLYPDTVRIVLSGFSELETVTAAINRGAIFKYLSKPWDDDDLREEVRLAFRQLRKAEQ